LIFILFCRRIFYVIIRNGLRMAEAIEADMSVGN
jgi:hypothetical protein